MLFQTHMTLFLQKGDVSGNVHAALFYLVTLRLPKRQKEKEKKPYYNCGPYDYTLPFESVG